MEARQVVTGATMKVGEEVGVHIDEGIFWNLGLAFFRIFLLFKSGDSQGCPSRTLASNCSYRGRRIVWNQAEFAASQLRHAQRHQRHKNSGPAELPYRSIGKVLFIVLRWCSQVNSPHEFFSAYLIILSIPIAFLCRSASRLPSKLLGLGIVCNSPSGWGRNSLQDSSEIWSSVGGKSDTEGDDD